MLIRVFRYFSILFIILSFAGCGHKGTDETPPVYKISAVINGFKWTQNDITSNLLIDTNHSARVLDVRSSGSGKTVTIEVLNIGSGSSIHSGTYSFPNAYFRYSVSGGSIYNTVSGWISIDDVNNASQTVTGTFDFTVQDATTGAQTRISDGKLTNVSFSIVYQ